MKKKLKFVGVVFMGLLSFFSCKKTSNINEQNNLNNIYDKQTSINKTDDQIESFYFQYNGSIGGNGYTYDIKKDKNGKYIFTYETMMYREYGEMTTEVDQEFIEKLNKLYLDNNLYKWNGYHEVNKDCLDGWGFSLFIKNTNGKSMSASGSNKAPKGYREFAQQMDSLFTPILEKLKNDKRMEMIAKGISGQCDFVMANFKQQGNSGRDSYSIMITKKGVRTKNFDVNIVSDSGEIFPIGEKRYYCELDNKAIGFDKLTALIKKYKIINWYNFEQTDPDYNNKEWFQVSFGFGDKTINAWGTQYPENYQEFRQQLLLWVKDIIQSNSLTE